MIPAEAVEAAASAYLREFAHDENAEYIAKLVLEAAAPHMLSHEREQTRLAHLDAMVNRETKRSELAEAWDAGREIGIDECAGDIENPVNPYRSGQ